MGISVKGNMKNEASQTDPPLRVIHLEDDPLDAELIENELREQHIPCSITRISTRKEFEAALVKEPFDLILSDSKLPGFDTILALTLARQNRPTVPFIFVSGTLSPKIKADALLLGAADFIRKDDLPRLARVVKWLCSEQKHQRKVPPLPEIGAPVMVQCKDFRCLGYLDRQGTWRDFEKSSELTGVIDWSDL
jgi:CheY-like chemotaxis protein